MAIIFSRFDAIDYTSVSRRRYRSTASTALRQSVARQ